MTAQKVELETTVIMDRIGNTDQYALMLLYADPEISPNYPSLGTTLFIGGKDETAMRLELLQKGEPTPDIRRVLEDIYEGQLKKFLFPRLFGISI